VAKLTWPLLHPKVTGRMEYDGAGGKWPRWEGIGPRLRPTHVKLGARELSRLVKGIVNNPGHLAESRRFSRRQCRRRMPRSGDFWTSRTAAPPSVRRRPDD